MSNQTFDLTTMFDTYRQSLAPVAKAQQEALKILETFARYQLALAGDYIDWSVSQAKAMADLKSPSDFVTQQSELSTKAGEQIRKRSQELSQIAADTQGTVKQWIGEAGAKLAEVAKKAA
jgi:phasin family protein